MTDREGALRTLRKGFNVAGLGAGSAKFDMMQAKPETSLNPSTQARYEANWLRVMRQVHYGDGNKSIDLVFFLNGVPVATAEVKNREHTDCRERQAKSTKSARSSPRGRSRSRYSATALGRRALRGVRRTRSDDHEARRRQDAVPACSTAAPKTGVLATR